MSEIEDMRGYCDLSMYMNLYLNDTSFTTKSKSHSRKPRERYTSVPIYENTETVYILKKFLTVTYSL